MSVTYRQLAPDTRPSNHQGGSSERWGDTRSVRTRPSSIAQADSFHDGRRGSPRLAETTSGCNPGVFVSSELRIAEVVDSPHSIFTLACFCPSIPRSAVFFPLLSCHAVTLQWFEGFPNTKTWYFRHVKPLDQPPTLISSTHTHTSTYSSH